MAAAEDKARRAIGDRDQLGPHHVDGSAQRWREEHEQLLEVQDKPLLQQSTQYAPGSRRERLQGVLQ